MQERFKQIQGFPDYQIGELGTVKSKSFGVYRTLKPKKTPKGYLKIELCFAGSTKIFLLHRLVAIHFIPNPDNLPEVNHLDGDKTNCKKSNLEWCTRSQNNQHAFDTGLRFGMKNEQHPNSKLTLSQVEQIRFLKGKEKQKDLAIKFGISRTQISLIQNGKRWTV